MAEIELAIMSRGPSTAEDLAPLLQNFEARTRTRVRLQVLEWDGAWAEVLKVALYQHGPTVSEIGSTWLGSLVGMNVLEPFSDYEVDAFERTSTFIPSAWQSGALALRPGGRPVQWAIPWWADTRLLNYRRDILARAGLDVATAFASFEQLERTLDRLVAAGVALPWVVPTHRSRMTLHNVASWVWGAGGHFVSDDARRVLLDEPEARAGLRTYFALARYLGDPARDLDDTESDSLFCSGQAAMTISGPWLARTAAPQVIEQLGVALPPGTPFVGGSHLVCWRHAPYHSAAIKLIQFLTGQEVQSTFGRQAGLLPTRLDVLSSPAFAGDALSQAAARGLQQGRSFRTHRLWGLVEDKLNVALARVWSAVLAQASPDLDQILDDYLNPVIEQLNITLSSRS